jgi:hypothetical protein
MDQWAWPPVGESRTMVRPWEIQLVIFCIPVLCVRERAREGESETEKRVGHTHNSLCPIWPCELQTPGNNNLAFW